MVVTLGAVCFDPRARACRCSSHSADKGNCPLHAASCPLLSLPARRAFNASERRTGISPFVVGKAFAGAPLRFSSSSAKLPRRHAAFRPWPLSGECPHWRGVVREAGREAVPPKLIYTWRDVRAPPATLGSIPSCFATAPAPAFPPRLAVLKRVVQRTPHVVAEGGPSDKASPAMQLRRQHDGGAGSSPLSNDSGSVPGGRNCGQLCGRCRERGRNREKNHSRKINGFRFNVLYDFVLFEAEDFFSFWCLLLDFHDLALADALGEKS
jgi:hypothetical protein